MAALPLQLRSILSDKAGELFTAYGITSELVADAPMDGHRLCGILGFTGANLCGSIVIAATREAIASCLPIPDSSAAQWLGELTNQLVGRFKNELLRRGIEIWMSLPVVLTATQVVPIPHGPVEPIHFRLGGAPLTVWLETEGSAVLQPPTEIAIPSEGDLIMF